MNCILNSLESYYFDLCGNSRITTLAHSMSSIKLFGLFLVSCNIPGIDSYENWRANVLVFLDYRRWLNLLMSKW